MNCVDEVKNEARIKAGNLEPWGNYFELRGMEMENLLSFINLKDCGKLLEIGCGNGFNSCVLSKFADSVIATDLYGQDSKSHSVGMGTAKELTARLAIRNCELVSCSGEDLPFKAGMFDMVFSMYTLEHVPNREKMIADVKRVLKKGGLFIVIVPNFMERVAYYPVIFYADFLSAMWHRLFTRSSGRISKKDTMTIVSGDDNLGIFERMKKNRPHFPLPEPHGAYKNYFDEVYNYLPSRWKRLLLESGLEEVDIFSFMVLPRNLISLVFRRFGLDIYKRLSWIERRVGGNPVIKNFGQNICFILRKA
ncbi:MAG: class I SAM-dependent methyltransferase [Candidatus Omnitrophota bacterium]|jgi:ubiquinone/menaquinone biosynthesis C-methylase UbiE